MNPIINGAKVRPYGEDYMVPAWVSAFKFFAAKPELCDIYKAETGHDFNRMLEERNKQSDSLTGPMTEQEEAILAGFADWFTERVWGVEETTPPKIET